MPLAVWTPGTLPAASTTGAGIDWKFWPWMIMSLVIERSIAPRNESLKPFTNTRHEHDQGDADHQRRRGHGGAARVA